MAGFVGEAELRRLRSLSKLQQHNIQIIDHLPTIETVQETRRRTPREVGPRVLCLALVSMKGAGADHQFVLEGVQHFDVRDDLSPDESAFVFDPQPSDHTMLQFSWRVEAAHALMWSLGLVDTLLYPSTTCDWNAFWDGFHRTTRTEFLEKLSLREQAAILDEADLIYRIHWAARDAELNGLDPPAGLNSSVVLERHYALNWLAAPIDAGYPWDDVPTDT